MNLSIGVNRDKELNEIMKRVKRPRIFEDFEEEECIYSCDDNYDEYNCKNDDEYDLEDDDDMIKDMMKCDCKALMYVGLGVVVGALGVYLLRR